MSERLARWAAANGLAMACVAMVNVSISASRTQAPQLPDILSRAAAYLERYEQQIPSVIAQEDYLQSFGGINGLTDRARTVRRLRSDLLILADETGWVEFRDVYEVDGKQVRDRDDRLMRLFMQPNPDSRVQAGRIVAESARFNLDVPRLRFRRTLNVPMTALRFCAARTNRARHSRSARSSAAARARSRQFASAKRPSLRSSARTSPGAPQARSRSTRSPDAC